MDNKPLAIGLWLNPAAHNAIKLPSCHLDMWLQDMARAGGIERRSQVIGIQVVGRPLLERVRIENRGYTSRSVLAMARGTLSPCGAKNGRSRDRAPDYNIPTTEPSGKTKGPYPSIKCRLDGSAPNAGAKLPLRLRAEKSNRVNSMINLTHVEPKSTVPYVNNDSALLKEPAEQNLWARERGDLNGWEVPRYGSERGIGNGFADRILHTRPRVIMLRGNGTGPGTPLPTMSLASATRTSAMGYF